MVFKALLYISLAIFVLGLIYKISTWFSRKVGISAQEITTSERVSAAVKGILGVIFSAKILTLIKVFILDVVLQIRILKEDFLRWFMHMLIYMGFMLLLLMHALEDFISEPLFTDYYSTVNPFMFLRDLFGLMVIIGVGIALYRRFILKVPRLKTKAMDHYAIIILAVIMISGIMLEGVKITSHTEFQTMVEDYAGLTFDDDPDEVMALESYWVKGFGVVSPNVKAPFDEDALSQGQEIHEESCMDCHSSPRWAFTGYAFAKISKPIALALDRADASNILWYIHFLACFIGLAYLPFSKFFHIFSSPISLLVNGVADHDSSEPANVATRRAIELDACTQCGTCSLHCSVAPVFNKIPNANILPSEKLLSLKALSTDKQLGAKEIYDIQEGSFICTSCHRCTTLCPVGINLHDMWLASREDLAENGFPEPQGLARENGAAEVSAIIKDVKDGEACYLPGGHSTIKHLSLSDKAATFSGCLKCITCTVECPVVANYNNPAEALDLMPHQIMHALGLGLKELVLGSRMIWDCLGCYLCQEHCPMGVKVTDVFYELKNISYELFKTAELSGGQEINDYETPVGRSKGAAS